MIRSICAPLGVSLPTTMNVIPAITDPQGRSWRQPDTDTFEIDDTHAMMTRRDFDQLAEYSTSQPTGVYHGKCWKARSYLDDDQPFRPTGPWVLRWFGHDPNPNYCSNNQREIIIID